MFLIHPMMCFWWSTGVKRKAILQASDWQCWGTAPCRLHSNCWRGMPKYGSIFFRPQGLFISLKEKYVLPQLYHFPIYLFCFSLLYYQLKLIISSGVKFLRFWRIGLRRKFKLLLSQMGNEFWGLGTLAARYIICWFIFFNYIVDEFFSNNLPDFARVN